MRRTALSLAVVLAGLHAGAQQYAFKQFTAQDGLAQSQVRSMAQDGDGYLWFGTLGGASRFDGERFENHALQDGLPDALVSAMATAPDGDLWLGAGHTVVHRDGARWTQHPLPIERGIRILGLTFDKQGRLLVGTDGGGLFVLENGKAGPLEGYPQDTAQHVRCLLTLRDGRILVGLRNGLLLWDNGRCSSVILGRKKLANISALAEGLDGGWWVGTYMDGLFHSAPDGRVTTYTEENGLVVNNVRGLLVDRSGRLWVGTKFGVNLLDHGRMRLFTVHQGMPNDNIYCLFQDQEDNIWLGTDGAGVLRYIGDRFVTYTVKDGLCSDLVMTAVADAQGGIWLGTYDNGICRIDGMAMVNTTDGLPNNTVWCGLLDRTGALWFGTNDGLAKIERGVVQRLPDDQAMPDLRVLSLLEDRSGDIWCGTREGVVVVHRTGGATRHPAAPNGPGRSVRSMVHDAQGRIWMASDNGIGVFDGTAFRAYTQADGLCDNTVQCLLYDAGGRLWAGTTNGLALFDGRHFHTFRFASDFGSNNIGLLLTDRTGRIWAGTNNGLYVFHPDSLVADHEAHMHITLNDGLRNMEFNLNAGFRDQRGRLFFGSAGGLVMHDPARHPAQPEQRVPQVHITRIRSFLQRTNWEKESSGIGPDGLPMDLELPYGRNHLTFDYTGICMSAPERVRYRYRLVGMDDEWLPPTDARFASYSNLRNGHYTFEVTAAVGDGPWSAPVSFSFTIAPPFWLRWWFFLLVAVAAGAIVWGTMRYRALARQRSERTRQLMLRSRMLQLEQQALNANMNRHFVFNALNSIQYHINKQDRATASRYLTSFAKLMRKNLDASRNDTTTLAEELERLELYLLLEHMRFKDRFRYSIVVEPGVDTSKVMLPAMMLQPYVENSIWHGILPMERQGSVHIHVSAPDPGHVLVRIDDDGIGVEQSLKAKQENGGDHISRGIEITKGRADVLRKLAITDIRITGPIQWHDPDTGAVMGTRVLIELPVIKTTEKSQGGLQYEPPSSIFGRP
jgi:ligand-binding sensor domain-containing protein/two-component sensor histidine kinase